jgi:O-antigen/teichoic acid export membrane protein
MKTLNTTPKIIKIGSALGFIGGLICIFCLAFFFEADDSMLTYMGVYMLLAVMFFALAGGLSRGGQWTWSTLMLMAFLTISAVCCSVVFEIVDLNVAIILAIVGALIVLCLAMPASRIWVDITKT